MQFSDEKVECALLFPFPSDSSNNPSLPRWDLVTESRNPMLTRTSLQISRLSPCMFWVMRRRSYEDAVAGEERLREREGELYQWLLEAYHDGNSVTGRDCGKRKRAYITDEATDRKHRRREKDEEYVSSRTSRYRICFLKYIRWDSKSPIGLFGLSFCIWEGLI